MEIPEIPTILQEEEMIIQPVVEPTAILNIRERVNIITEAELAITQHGQTTAITLILRQGHSRVLLRETAVLIRIASQPEAATTIRIRLQQDHLLHHPAHIAVAVEAAAEAAVAAEEAAAEEDKFTNYKITYVLTFSHLHRYFFEQN